MNFTDHIFDLCVDFLIWLAGLLGISYNAINVWIFVIIWPILTAILIFLVLFYGRKYRRLKVEINRCSSLNI